MAEIGAGILEEERKQALGGAISQLADAVLKAETERDSIEEQAKAKDAELASLREQLAKELGLVGLSDVTLEDGRSIAISMFQKYYVRKPDELQQFTWLRDNDAGGLVKSRESVHWASFTSHCKALVEAGEELPEFVQLFERQEVKVKKGGE